MADGRAIGAHFEIAVHGNGHQRPEQDLQPAVRPGPALPLMDGLGLCVLGRQSQRHRDCAMVSITRSRDGRGSPASECDQGRLTWV